MNFYSQGFYNNKIKEAYSYDKKKKELKDVREQEDNSTERCCEKKTTS